MVRIEIAKAVSFFSGWANARSRKKPSLFCREFKLYCD